MTRWVARLTPETWREITGMKVKKALGPSMQEIIERELEEVFHVAYESMVEAEQPEKLTTELYPHQLCLWPCIGLKWNVATQYEATSAFSSILHHAASQGRLCTG